MSAEEYTSVASHAVKTLLEGTKGVKKDKVVADAQAVAQLSRYAPTLTADDVRHSVEDNGRLVLQMRELSKAGWKADRRRQEARKRDSDGNSKGAVNDAKPDSPLASPVVTAVDPPAPRDAVEQATSFTSASTSSSAALSTDLDWRSDDSWSEADSRDAETDDSAGGVSAAPTEAFGFTPELAVRDEEEDEEYWEGFRSPACSPPPDGKP